MNEIIASNLESVRKQKGHKKVACVEGPKRLRLRGKSSTGRGKLNKKVLNGKKKV